MPKEDGFDQKVSAWLSMEQVHDIKISGLSLSEYIRDSVDMKRLTENNEFIQEKKKELEKELLRLTKHQDLIEKQKQDFKKIPEKEISWLLDCKRLLEDKPDFTDGRMKIYVNNFPKPYRITKQHFFKLMEEAENQSQEREVFQEVRR